MPGLAYHVEEAERNTALETRAAACVVKDEIG